jgi:hypothetical protein
MSERSSLVSQYFYCEKCRDVFEDAMREMDFSQPGRGWARHGDAIIVAYVGGLWGGESAFEVENALGEVAGRFCHEVFATVIDDSIGPVTFMVEDGEVTRHETFTREESRAQTDRALARRKPTP